MVVEESAVCTAFIFSSADATEAMLTTPTAASPIVHLLNFIWFLRSLVGSVLCFRMHFLGKTSLPAHQNGAFVGETRRGPGVWQHLFFAVSASATRRERSPVSLGNLLHERRRRARGSSELDFRHQEA